MRIAHVIDYFHTDVGYQEYYLAKTQAEAGHEVLVLTSTFRHHNVGVSGPDEDLGARALERAGVQVRRLAGWQLGHDRAWLRGLKQAFSDHLPEAVHSHSPFSATTVRTARACRSQGVGLLVDTHIQEAIAPSASITAAKLTYQLYRAAFGRFLRSAVGDWVANGPHEARFLSQRLGVPRDRIELEPLGFDPEVFRFDEKTRRLERARRKWDDDQLIVAVTGKVHPGKRPDLVARACESRHHDRPLRLIIAGQIQSTTAAAVRSAAPRLVAEGRIEHSAMLGREELARLYLAADVVVFARLPSISIYEAAGTGAHVLVGRDEFSDWLHSMHANIRPVDIDDFAGELEPSKDRGAEARRASRRFAWPVISAAFVDRYEALT